MGTITHKHIHKTIPRTIHKTTPRIRHRTVVGRAWGATMARTVARTTDRAGVRTRNIYEERLIWPLAPYFLGFLIF